MFIGREQELQELIRLSQNHTFQIALVTGRRKIGKTALLNEFCRRKDAIYYSALETNSVQNAVCLDQVLSRYVKLKEALPSHTTILEALEYLFELSCSEQLILAIDNYPYLAKTDKLFASGFAELLRKYEGHAKLLLVLAGTSGTVMDQQFFQQKSPLYGKAALTLTLQPFDFFECRKFFRSFSAIDLARIYGILGGIPQYLQLLNERLSVEDNIKALFLNPSSPLFEETTIILRQEVREPSLYNAIISAIANGADKLSSIAAAVDEETSVCATYLKILLSMQIVRKESPVTDSSTKKTIYRIHDPLFRFWYRFLPECMTEVCQGKTAAAYRIIESQFSGYMDDVFEEICRQYMLQLSQAKKLPSPITKLGCWWGVDPFTKEALRIDILAETEDKETALFGSCFWNNHKVTETDLRRLIEYSSLFPYPRKHYYLFAKNGFSRDCYDLANELQTVTLINFSK